MATRGLVLGTEALTTDDLLAIAVGRPVRLGAAARARMAVSRSVLLAAVERGDAVYGSTRRLGAGVDDPIQDSAAFQRQVIRNHAGALGEPLSKPFVRAAIAARLTHLVLGGSGARPQVAEALAALLDADILPVVPERGSVGVADLAQLAAVAQVLTGEGLVVTDDGRLIPGAEALAAAGLTPLVLETHEALALISTDAFTIGASALAVPRLEVLSETADTVAALALEAAAAHRASGDLAPFSEVVHADFEPSGQWRSATMIREVLEGSFLHDDRDARLQDELAFRCVPQVHGAFADDVEVLADRVDEVLAVRPENPLVDVESRTVTANGNFAATGLTLALESARVAIEHVGSLSERRTAVLSGLARPLRAAERAGIPGLLAYTAAEGVVLLRRLAAPVSLASPVLSEVEDYATWGWTAARAVHETLDQAEELLAIEALHAASLLRGAPSRPALGRGTAPIFDGLLEVLDRGGDLAEDLVNGARDVLLAGD